MEVWSEAGSSRTMRVTKTIIAAFGTAVLLAGCSGSLWPSLEAEDPAGSAPASQTSSGSASATSAGQGQPIRVAASGQSGTFVGNKTTELNGELDRLGGNVQTLEQRFAELQTQSEQGSLAYQQATATIMARLQTGTTPGNPVLVSQWEEAQGQLERISETLPRLRTLANDAAQEAAFGNYLLSSVQATYGLSGAVESDHVRLRVLEDAVYQQVVQIDRLMGDMAQAEQRQTGYLNSERQNLTTLSLAIKNGELYGTSLASRAFIQADQQARIESQSVIPAPSERALVVVRFDRPGVNYQQALYNAVSQALERKPTASFDVVAVNPSAGTAAQQALNASAARRHAEDVLRTLTGMGVQGSRVQLIQAADDVANNEVRVFVR